MKIKAMAMTALMVLSTMAVSGEIDENGYLGDRSETEKKTCKSLWKVFGSGTICFLEGRSLVVGDGTATRELLDALKPDSERNSDDAFWAHQRVKMLFSMVFGGSPGIDFSVFDNVITKAPRPDMCRKMNRAAFLKIEESPEHKEVVRKGLESGNAQEVSRDFVWERATKVKCPKGPWER